MKRSDQYQKIRELTDAAIDNQASAEQIEQLKKLLANDPDAQRFYFDYVGVHTRLKASAANNIEFVYRRMTEEELIMRPVGQTSDALNSESNRRSPLDHDTNPTDDSANNASKTAKNSENKLKGLAILCLLLAIFCALFIWLNDKNEPKHFYAILFNGDLNIGEFGQVKGNHLLAGEYHIKQKSSIGLKTGETLNLVEGSVIKLLSNNKIELIKGALSIVPVPNNSLEVRTKHLTLHSNGGPLSLDLRFNKPKLESGPQTLFSPHRWRPIHYWSFDGHGDRALDLAGSSDGVLYPGVTRVKGLLGQGAFLFDNSDNARLNLGSGGGSVMGTGTFSATEGVTIEALIKSNYSGKLRESDHIFRKGQSDGQFRILLSFQNDRGKNYLRPKGDFKESLSFGLFILGQGYHELKLPLDGLNGRPTLAQMKDGQYHHIVATYNATTGLKAIYIDGEQLASYQYPPGSKMLSGGAGEANIGNSPTFPRLHHSRRGYNIDSSGEIEIEPLTRGIFDVHSAAFNGVIDEVAFYDFSLPALMINNHFEQIQKGYNYFGLNPSAEHLPGEIKLPLPAYSTVELDPVTGQPQHIINSHKH